MEMQVMLYVTNLKDLLNYSKNFLFEFGFKEKIDVAFWFLKTEGLNQYLS